MEGDNDADGEPEAEGHPGLRVSHNVVEKKYRTRLNMQFTSLLDSIPPEITQFDGYLDAGGRGGKVSKGDVLGLAKRCIQTLKQDKKSLEVENMEYKQIISCLKAGYAKSGGEHMV